MDAAFKKPLLFMIACLIVGSCVFLYNGLDVSLHNRPGESRYSWNRLMSVFGNATSSHAAELTTCPIQKPRKHILFAAKARTGSTFIGELFNQNPNVFYLFEPLRVIPDMVKLNAIPDTYRGEMSAELLHSFYHCDFLTYYAYQIQRWSLAIFESKALQRICDSKTRCPTVKISELVDTCSRYEAMVMKSIRVDNLEYLLPLLERECFDLKVVLLVRDPRAVASSRKHFKFHFSTYKSLQELGIARPMDDTTIALHPANVHDYCKWLARNIAVLKSASPRALSKLMVLRYEDIVSNVTQKALELYEMFGLQASDEVLHWIKGNTQSKKNPSRGSMDTKRNSTSTAQAWRTDLKMKDVELVQGACSDVIQELGYKLIQSENELTDMTLSFVDTLPLKGNL